MVTTDRLPGLGGGRGGVAGRSSLVDTESPTGTTGHGVVTGTGDRTLFGWNLFTDTTNGVVTVAFPSVLNTGQFVSSTSASSLARSRGHTVSTGVGVGGEGSVGTVDVTSSVTGSGHGGDDTRGGVVDGSDVALTTDLSRVSGTRGVARKRSEDVSAFPGTTARTLVTGKTSHSLLGLFTDALTHLDRHGIVVVDTLLETGTRVLLVTTDVSGEGVDGDVGLVFGHVVGFDETTGTTTSLGRVTLARGVTRERSRALLDLLEGCSVGTFTG